MKRGSWLGGGFRGPLHLFWSYVPFNVAPVAPSAHVEVGRGARWAEEIGGGFRLEGASGASGLAAVEVTPPWG